MHHLWLCFIFRILCQENLDIFLTKGGSSYLFYASTRSVHEVAVVWRTCWSSVNVQNLLCEAIQLSQSWCVSTDPAHVARPQRTPLKFAPDSWAKTSVSWKSEWYTCTQVDVWKICCSSCALKKAAKFFMSTCTISPSPKPQRIWRWLEPTFKTSMLKRGSEYTS